MRRVRGFTLIELLVVIAIIAILAAILFPVFMSAKARAHQSACMANMKELSGALYTYLGNWQDTFPANRFQDPLMPSGASAKLDKSRFNWKTALQSVMKHRGDLWKCAANRNSDSPDETGTDPGVVGAVGQVSTFPISYAYNGDFFNELEYPTYFPKPIKLGQIRRPTQLLIIVESVRIEPDIHANYVTESQAMYTDYSSGQNVRGCQVVIHAGKTTNCIFTDTHARSMRLRETLVPQSYWYSGRQNHYDYPRYAEELAKEAQ